MQNQTEVQKRAALDALDQAYEYWSGDTTFVAYNNITEVIYEVIALD